MEQPLRLALVLTLLGLVAVGAFGFTQAQTMSCEVDGIGERTTGETPSTGVSSASRSRRTC